MAAPGSGGAFRFRFTIDGVDTVSVALSRWGESLVDLRQFFRTWLLPKLWRDVEGNFTSQGADAGGWLPLSPRYAAWKNRFYPGKPILQREGRLLRSLELKNGGWGPATSDSILEIGAQQLVYGTRRPAAEYHQHGGSKSGRPPMRRFLFLFNGASETFGRFLHAYAHEMARGAGLFVDAPSPIQGGPGGGGLL